MVGRGTTGRETRDRDTHGMGAVSEQCEREKPLSNHKKSGNLTNVKMWLINA